MSRSRTRLQRVLLLVSFTLVTTMSVFVTRVVAVEDALCSLPPVSYAKAKTAHPNFAFALSALEDRGIATWYSDREANGDYLETARQLVAKCPTSSRLSVVVYGLPNKDCEAGYSTTGSRVKTSDDYRTFLEALAKIVDERKVLYVLEPDAIGLLANGGCAVEAGYKANLVTAISILSANPNAVIYADVGFWTLMEPAKASTVASILQELAKAGRLKGITLNTSNYRPTSEMAKLCGDFQKVYGSTDLHCIIDTARNFNDTSSSEWCNRRTAGIGHPPTSSTGLPGIDYFVWIKPPGESDGECNKGDHTSEAMVGPGAGEFFPEAFKLLWNNGYLHKKDKLKGIDLPASRIGTGIIVLVVIVVVAVVGLGGFVLWRRRQQLAKAGNYGPQRSPAYAA